MALQIAVLSTSRIVAEVMREIGNWPEVEVTAIVCRPQSAEKAHAWAAEYGVPAVYTDEAAAYAAGGFDAVYIGTANHLHYAAAKRALQAGYHVLLEKPFTATAAEARELFALADAKGLVLMEAITIPYLPQYAFLQAELPKIGEVRGAMASFCARSARYDDYLKGIWNTTFDPACLGGALNDMNVYNLHLLCGLLGVPGRAEYRPSCGPNGIDTAVHSSGAGRQGQRGPQRHGFARAGRLPGGGGRHQRPARGVQCTGRRARRRHPCGRPQAGTPPYGL